jgi:hypothetical protein
MSQKNLYRMGSAETVSLLQEERCVIKFTKGSQLRPYRYREMIGESESLKSGMS